MKIALIYTSTISELIELVEKEVGDVPSREIEVASYQDLSILTEVKGAGYVTALLVARLASMCMTAVSEGADVILNPCSSVGEVVDAAQNIVGYMGILTVRMDKEICQEAMRRGKRIGVMAILPTTLNPTRSTILRVIRKMNRQVKLMDALVDGGSSLDQEQFKDFTSGYAGITADKVNVILLAQGSMAYREEYIYERYGRVVLSSPRFDAVTLKDALVKKGLV